MSLNDHPEKIAKGFALGSFIGMIPIPGFQVLVSVGISSALKWNRLAAGIAVFNTNVLTGPFIFGINYLLGAKILGLNPEFKIQSSGLEMAQQIFTAGWDVAKALWLGGLILGIPFALIAYIVLKSILQKKDFSKKLNEKAFTMITGASSGLGKAMAIECAKNGQNLLLIALPNESLQFLAKSLTDKYLIHAYCFEIDLRDKKQMLECCQYINRNYSVQALINNAGIGGSCSFTQASISYLEDIILLNVRATSLITRLILPNLQQQNKAYILNISSLAAFSPLAYKTVYPASKSFIHSFSRGLSEELKSSNIHVCSMYPGPIMTNPDVSRRIAQQGRLAKLGLLSAEELAHIGITSMLKQKKVVIPGTFNKLSYFMSVAMPNSFSLPIMSRIVQREIKSMQAKEYAIAN